MRLPWMPPFLAVALLWSGLARAQVPACDALTGEARTVARVLLDSEHPYDCCDDTISACLKKQPGCRLVPRLAAFVCRRAASGQDRDAIRRALERRSMSMMPGTRKHTFDLAGSPPVGCTQAPVQVVAYLCARCPFCSKLLPSLYREVTTGTLAGRVALHARLFPIKSHAYSAEANIAVVAAGRLGRFWEFLLRAYQGFEGFSVERLPEWAAAVGLDRAAFDAAVADPATRAALADAKKEGLRNGVEATPTLFINGRKYLGDLDIETLVDVIEEEIEAGH